MLDDLLHILVLGRETKMLTCDVRVVWVPQFLRTPQFTNVFGLLEFYVFGDSREFCNSDIVVPLTRMQAEGKSN